MDSGTTELQKPEGGHCWHGDATKELHIGECCSPASVSEESTLDWDLTLSTCHHNKRPAGDGVPPAVVNQYSENSAVYFLWPPVYRPHGSAGEREAYFQGLQKAVDFTSTERTPSGQQATTLLDLMTIRAYNSRLLRQVSLGTAVGFRTRKGVLTDIPAIIVFVAHKVHTAWLHESLRLPVHLEGPGGVWCDVDVVEFYYYGAPAVTPKELVYTDLAEGLRGNNPYISPGSQVASQETLGTLGAIVRSRTGTRQVGFLTNRHVAVNLDYPSQKMYHPLPPPNVGPGVYLGAVERATSFITDEGWYNIFASTNPETFVRADGAFIPFAETFDLSRIRTSVDGIGEMGNAINIDLQAPVSSIVGKQVAKVGRSSGLTKGTIMAYALEYNDEKGICFFTDFLIVGENKQAFDLEGDSGSLILMTERGDKKKPVGIIWGGTANRGRLKLRNDLGPENWTSGVDLGRLLEWLQLDLITTQAGLEAAIEEQRKLTMGAAPAGGPPVCLSDVERLAEVNHCYSMHKKWVHPLLEKEEGQSHASKETFLFMPTTSCKQDAVPINFIKELEFGIKDSKVSDSGNVLPTKPVVDMLGGEDISFGLHLSDKDAKRRRQ